MVPDLPDTLPEQMRALLPDDSTAVSAPRRSVGHPNSPSGALGRLRLARAGGFGWMIAPGIAHTAIDHATSAEAPALMVAT